MRNQSLAEATVEAGAVTARHHHRRSEELYFILEGEGVMEIDGEERSVRTGDGILIPAGARHRITATRRLRFLCCCAPPYADEDTWLD